MPAADMLLPQFDIEPAHRAQLWAALREVQWQAMARPRADGDAPGGAKPVLAAWIVPDFGGGAAALPGSKGHVTEGSNLTWEDEMRLQASPGAAPSFYTAVA